MIQPDAHPLDVLATFARKAAFLADAINALSYQKSHCHLSPRGLEGLAEYLGDLEEGIVFATNKLKEV